MKNGLNKKQLESLKIRVIHEKERVEDGLTAEFDAYKINVEDLTDEVDQAASDQASSQLIRFRNRDVFYIKKLNKAIDKMNSGEYGICEDCGDQIKYERLLARPTAELCIVCKEESEKEEFNSFTGRMSKSLGKAIDLVQSI
jgi:DnaK suppressor protein